MLFCYLLVVFLLGTVANGMTTSLPTRESTIPNVSTIDSTTNPSSTPSPSSAASPTEHITTAKHSTESTPEESTGPTSTTMTTEMASSHPPAQSSITHSTTILGDTTTSEKSTSSTTRPVDSSSPHNGTTLSTESSTTAEPTTKLTTEIGKPSSTVPTTSLESTTPAETTTTLPTETSNPSSTVPTNSAESTTPTETATTLTTETTAPSSGVSTTSQESTTPTEPTSILTTETGNPSSEGPTTSPETTTSTEPATAVTTETGNPSSTAPTTSPESTSTADTAATLTAETGNPSSEVPTTSPESTTSTEPATAITTETVTDSTTQTTSLTHSTEPASGMTTVPTSTIPSGSTTVTVKPTSTTMRPTDINTSTTTPPQTTTPIPPFIECPAKPCPVESVCLDGTCQCLSGSFLQNGRCIQAQVFPGQLHLTSLEFQSEMSNRSSAIFLSTAANISETLRVVLSSQPGYVKSDVVQLTEGSVQATVNNIFEETNATQESIDNVINQAINDSTSGLLANADFTVTELCDQKPVPCDVITTNCVTRSGRAFCSCKKGFISNVYSNSSCTACPSGKEAVGDTCKPCPFGYAGFNCSDSSLLAVVVISCVLGGVLLIMVLALLAYGGWTRYSKKKTDYNNSPYPAENLSQPWPIQGVTPIPRATTKWDAAPPIEMTEAGSTNTLVDRNNQTNGQTGSYDLNLEQMKTFKGKNPSRYSYLVQGHENPYFIPGDEKRN